MEIKYQFFEKDNLLIQSYSGDFSFEQYMQYMGFFESSFDLRNISKVIIDFRLIRFTYELENFKERMEQIIAIRKELHEKKIKRTDTIMVFWVDKPIPIAIAKIFKEIFSDLNYNYCSSTNSVHEHLNTSAEIFDLEYISNNLENTFQE